MNIRRLLLSLLFLCAIRTSFGDNRNYYVIDGANEDNNVIKLWHTTIGLLDEYDRGVIAGFDISFNCNGKHFNAQRGPNWWEYYFAFHAIGLPEKSSVLRVPRYQRSVVRFKTVCTMSPERGNFLLNKYMTLQPAILEKIADIKQEYWPHNMPVVGVYYQKPIMPEVQQSWDPATLSNYVKESIKEIGECKICLLTDLEGFAETFSKQFASKLIRVQRLENNNQTLPDERGEHELLTLLMLAQCDIVIAPGSYQGIGAKMLNPALKLIELDTIPYARLT
jgi:hypothetical protein